MANIIIIALLILIEGLAVFYIYREKKKGKACIGCPYSGSCCSKKGGGCSSNLENKSR